MEESATCEDGEKACSGVRRRQGRREGDWLGLGPPGSYLVIYLFGGFIPDFLTEFKTSPLGLIFSLSSKVERKEEKRMISLFVQPSAIEMTEILWAQKREKERKKQKITRQQNTTETGPAGNREEGQRWEKSREGRREEGSECRGEAEGKYGGENGAIRPELGAPEEPWRPRGDRERSALKSSGIYFPQMCWVQNSKAWEKKDKLPSSCGAGLWGWMQGKEAICRRRK